MPYTPEQYDIAAQRYLKLESFFREHSLPSVELDGGWVLLAAGTWCVASGQTLGEAIDNLPPRTNQILR